jgi:hypothetical protein
VDFPDYFEVVEPLVLPINGKKYTIPPITLDGGVKLADGLSTKTKTILTDEEFLSITLGAALDEMRADSVKPEAIERAARTAYADYLRDRGTALVLWKTGGDPKAMTELVSAALEEASTSTTTAEASTTPSPKSGSGTSRSRKKSSK